EFAALMAKVAEGDSALNPSPSDEFTIPLTKGGELPRAAADEYVSAMRGLGVSDAAIIEGMTGDLECDRSTFEAVRLLRAQKMADGAWVKELLAGSPGARRELALISIVVAGRPKD